MLPVAALKFLWAPSHKLGEHGKVQRKSPSDVARSSQTTIKMYTFVRTYGKFLDWPHEQIHLAAPSANDTCTGPDLTLAALMGEHEHCTEVTPLHVSFAAFEGAEAAAAAGADEKNGL
jgi:hypothetical protein